MMGVQKFCIFVYFTTSCCFDFNEISNSALNKAHSNSVALINEKYNNKDILENYKDTEDYFILAMENSDRSLTKSSFEKPSIERTYIIHIINNIVKAYNPHLTDIIALNLSYIAFKVDFSVDFINADNSNESYDEEYGTLLQKLSDTFMNISPIEKTKIKGRKVYAEKDDLHDFQIEDVDYEFDIKGFFVLIKHFVFPFIILLIMYVFVKSFYYLKNRLLVLILVLIIIQSIIVEMIKEYYQAYAKQHHLIMQGAPRICLPSRDLFWLERFSRFFTDAFRFRHDDCYKYYMNLHINPLMKISFLEIISSVIRNFFLNHFLAIAESAGAAINLLLYNLPVQWQIITFIAVIFLAVVFLLLYFKIEVRGFFFSLKHSNNPTFCYKCKVHLMEDAYFKKAFVDKVELHDERSLQNGCFRRIIDKFDYKPSALHDNTNYFGGQKSLLIEYPKNTKTLKRSFSFGDFDRHINV